MAKSPLKSCIVSLPCCMLLILLSGLLALAVQVAMASCEDPACDEDTIFRMPYQEYVWYAEANAKNAYSYFPDGGVRTYIETTVKTRTVTGTFFCDCEDGDPKPNPCTLGEITDASVWNDVPLYKCMGGSGS